jgi:hypothetical protein
MISTETFKTIRINRCEILLSESESLFLYNMFTKKILNESKSTRQIDFLKNILFEFLEKNPTRYFKEKDIGEVAMYYLEKINENRGQQNVGAKLSGSDSGVITPDNVLDYHTDYNIEHVANTFNETEDLMVFDEDGEVACSKEVESPDQSHVAIRQIQVNAITKSKK